MGAGMAGMAGMALSSYLNERQRRKATKHAGKTGTYSVSHIITYPSKELCSKMALGEGGVSLP